MSKLGLDRKILSQIAQGNALAIRQLERVFGDVGDMLPSTIEEANALAGSALAMAQANAALLAMLLEALEALETAPAPVPHVDPDDTEPRAHLGTISSQDADAVAITGGAVDDTPIGAATATTGKFTTLDASGQITSTVDIDMPPFVVTSTARVLNLNVARAAIADQAGGLGEPSTYPADATDLPSVIALANALKAANTAKGV